MRVFVCNDLILVAEGEKSLRGKVIKWKSSMKVKSLKMNIVKLVFFACPYFANFVTLVTSQKITGRKHLKSHAISVYLVNKKKRQN